MKKLIAMAFVLLFCISIYSQKKKAKSLKANTIVLAKTDQLSAEIDKNNFYLQMNNKDTINLKTVDLKNVPTDCKITPFKTKENNLYLITWIEKASIKTNLKSIYFNKIVLYKTTVSSAIFFHENSFKRSSPLSAKDCQMEGLT